MFTVMGKGVVHYMIAYETAQAQLEKLMEDFEEYEYEF